MTAKALNLSTGQESKFWKIETRRRIQRFIGGKQKDMILTLFYLSPYPWWNFGSKDEGKAHPNFKEFKDQNKDCRARGGQT